MICSSHHGWPKKWRMTDTAIVKVRRFGSSRTSCGNERAVSIRSANVMRNGAIYAVVHGDDAVESPCSGLSLARRVRLGGGYPRTDSRLGSLQGTEFREDVRRLRFFI